MKLIIVGGRDYRLSASDIQKLNEIDNVTIVVCGGATGVDADAEAWAHSRDIPVTRFDADWKRYGRAAGPIRNKAMAGYADAVALFPGGKGTASMSKEAQRVGIKLYDFS